jgi:hypothetical protein
VPAQLAYFRVEAATWLLTKAYPGFNEEEKNVGAD